MPEPDDGCRQYRDIRFSEERAQLVGWIRDVVEEYGRLGMRITVRQVYYQAVARGLMPSSGSTYARIQSALNDGRIAGLIPWSLVEDRGRGLRGLRTWSSPLASLREARRQYRTDLWADQEWRPEVWVEKAALEGVVGDICSADDVRVDFYATRGYDSQSQQYEAGRRMADYVRRGQRPIVFHLGDHDPSGVDMTRDVGERLSMFAGTPVPVQRLALTMPQIRQYDPPPFAVKSSDSRAADYVRSHGRLAWELDALDPSVLRELIREAVGRVRDPAVWEASLAQEVGDLREMDEMLGTMTGDD